MNPEEEVKAFAARILTAIDRYLPAKPTLWPERAMLDHRERVVSALRAIERAEEGLRYCVEWWGEPKPCDCDLGDGDGHLHHPALFRYFTEARDDAWADLKRTGSLYGVTDDDGAWSPWASVWDDKADAARAEYLRDEK